MSEIDLSTYGGSLLPLGIEGDFADAGPRRVETFINESATPIPIGVFVCLGAPSTGPKGNCKPLSGSSDLVIGITVRDPNRVRDSNGNLVYNRYEDVPVMTMGKLYVTPAETVRRGDQVLALTTGSPTGQASGSAAGASSSPRPVVVEAGGNNAPTPGPIGGL